MAAPSEASIQDQIAKMIKVLEELRLYAGVNAEKFLDHEDDLTQALETEFAADTTAGLQTFRDSLVSAITNGATMVTPLLREYGIFIEATEKNAQGIITRLIDHMIANNLTVKSRGFTFGSPSAGTNTGTGTIYRLNTDRFGNDIERQTADGKAAKCTNDKLSRATKEEELFEIASDAEQKDKLRIIGSGKLKSGIKALSARDSSAFINNPSFSQIAGLITAPTDLVSWAVTSIGDIEISESDVFRGFQGDVTPRSLEYKDNNKIVQKFSIRKPRFETLTPVFCAVAFKRLAGCDGTLTLRLGSVSESVVLAAQTGWNILIIGTTVKKDTWFDNFNESDPGIEVELSGRTVGTLLLDDLIIAPYVPHDGSWYAISAASTATHVAFLKEDTFTWTDTEVGSILQQWFWRIYNRYLPHKLVGFTFLEPT